MTAARKWTCRGCGAQWPRRKQLCETCGGRRPRRRTATQLALVEPYPDWEALYGPACNICGHVPEPGQRRLHRDHEHGSGRRRGLLCFRCNSALRPYMDASWLEAAAAYLRRAEGQW